VAGASDWRIFLFEPLLDFWKRRSAQTTNTQDKSTAKEHAAMKVMTHAIDYAKFRSRSHDAVIRVYDAAGNLIEAHEHAGEFKEW
jgi:hypothetical protein